MRKLNWRRGREGGCERVELGEGRDREGGREGERERGRRGRGREGGRGGREDVKRDRGKAELGEGRGKSNKRKGKVRTSLKHTLLLYTNSICHNSFHIAGRPYRVHGNTQLHCAAVFHVEALGSHFSGSEFGQWPCVFGVAVPGRGGWARGERVALSSHVGTVCSIWLAQVKGQRDVVRWERNVCYFSAL